VCSPSIPAIEVITRTDSENSTPCPPKSRARNKRYSTSKRRASNSANEEESVSVVHEGSRESESEMGNSRLQTESSSGRKRKNPRSAYAHYTKEKRPKFKLKNPTSTFKEIQQLLSQKWKHLSLLKRKPFEERAQVERENFELDNPNWKAKKGTPQKRKAQQNSTKRPRKKRKSKNTEDASILQSTETITNQEMNKENQESRSLIQNLSALNLQLNKYSTAFFCADSSALWPVEFLCEEGVIQLEV